VDRSNPGKSVVGVVGTGLIGVGNRLQFAVLREALNIVRSGAATPEVVDRVMKASPGRRWGIAGPSTFRRT